MKISGAILVAGQGEMEAESHLRHYAPCGHGGDPFGGFRELIIAEDLYRTMQKEREEPDGIDDPGDIGHNRDCLEGAHVAKAQLCVVPEGAGGKAGKIRGQLIEQPDFLVRHQHPFDGRDQYFLVILASHFAMRHGDDEVSSGIGADGHHRVLMRNRLQTRREG